MLSGSIPAFFGFYLCLFRNSTNSVSTLCTLGADGVI